MCGHSGFDRLQLEPTNYHINKLLPRSAPTNLLTRVGMIDDGINADSIANSILDKFEKFLYTQESRHQQVLQNMGRSKVELELRAESLEALLKKVGAK